MVDRLDVGYPFLTVHRTNRAVFAPTIHLDADVCCGDCPDGKRPIVQHPKTGRYYIVMGHPGFNTTANNGNGYRTWYAAARVIAKLGKKR